MANKNINEFFTGNDQLEYNQKYREIITEKGYHPEFEANSRLQSKVESVDLNQLAKHFDTKSKESNVEKMSKDSQVGPGFFSFQQLFAQWGAWNNVYYASNNLSLSKK